MAKYMEIGLWDTVKKSFAILSKSDRKKISAVTLIQILLGFLDLLGVLLIGLVVLLSANGINATPSDEKVTKLLNFFGLSNLSFQSQVAILGFVAAAVLISRTLCSMYFNRKILFYLSRRAAYISSNLIYRLLSQNLLVIQKRSSQESLYAVTGGVTSLMLGIIGTVITLTSDLFLLFILSIGLFAFNFLMAFITFVIFTLVSLVLYYSIQKKISFLANESVDKLVSSNELILEALNSYRDLFVRNRRSYYSKEISKSRFDLANISADLTFTPSLGKYVIEITLVFGAISLSALQFLLQDATQAIVTLSIFLAASSRIAPAVLRLQNGILSIKSSFGSVNKTILLMEDLSETTIPEPVSPLILQHNGFNPEIKLKNVFFKYPNSSNETLKNISLEIFPGEVVAVVGPSGAGKSTLIDLALGILAPSSGDVKISGMSPKDAINKWPGAIAYVPQDVNVINGSIKSNIAMGFPESEQIDDLILATLKIAQLEDFLLEKDLGLNSNVGERGSKISGGQRQRLGIARALYAKPRLVVLDEATSSLDGQTESEISEAIFSLKGKVTLILIAHRLSTVITADKIVYLENGEVLAIGTFNEVRNKIPNFDLQANLMGI